MPTHGKQYLKAKQTLPPGPHPPAEAVSLLREASYAKFDETVEVAINLGVDPRHADQMVRASVVLPHGTGKTKRILVIAQGEKVKEAEAAGADFVGGAELCKKIAEGWLEFDAVMPNPKTGTVTFDVARAVGEIQAGKLEFRVDKNGVVHAPVGKLSFTDEQLVENLHALVEAVLRAKPAAAKGKYLKSAYLSSTMAPSIPLDLSDISLQ